MDEIYWHKDFAYIAFCAFQWGTTRKNIVIVTHFKELVKQAETICFIEAIVPVKILQFAVVTQF